MRTFISGKTGFVVLAVGTAALAEVEATDDAAAEVCAQSAALIATKVEMAHKKAKTYGDAARWRSDNVLRQRKGVFIYVVATYYRVLNDKSRRSIFVAM